MHFDHCFWFMILTSWITLQEKWKDWLSCYDLDKHPLKWLTLEPSRVLIRWNRLLHFHENISSSLYSLEQHFTKGGMWVIFGQPFVFALWPIPNYIETYREKMFICLLGWACLCSSLGIHSPSEKKKSIRTPALQLVLSCNANIALLNTDMRKKKKKKLLFIDQHLPDKAAFAEMSNIPIYSSSSFVSKVTIVDWCVCHYSFHNYLKLFLSTHDVRFIWHWTCNWCVEYSHTIIRILDNSARYIINTWNGQHKKSFSLKVRNSIFLSKVYCLTYFPPKELTVQVNQSLCKVYY